MKILIKNAKVLYKNNEVISDCSISLKDDLIEDVFFDKQVITGSYDRVINASGMIALPGLVNAHTHSAMTLLRNYGGDLNLEDWLTQKIFPAEKQLSNTDIYYGTMLAGVEMIRSGTTAFADMYLAPDEMAQAVCELGLRANICQLPIDPEGSEFSPAKEFFKSWHKQKNDRIKPYILVHSAYLYGQKELIKSAVIAKELGTGIHTHLLETKAEYTQGVEKYGMDNALEMDKCGIFDVPVIAAHCVHVTDEIIGLLASRKVSVSHNPTSNLKLGSGIAPVKKMLDAGINVCLGTDGTASNNTLDMFEEMKLAALLQKGVNYDATIMKALDVIKMATENGARALGFDYEYGIIKKGAKADIILIDTNKAHLTPLNDPLEAVVYCATGSDVDTVIADGRILMEKRELKFIDEEKIIYESNKIAKRILKQD